MADIKTETAFSCSIKKIPNDFVNGFVCNFAHTFLICRLEHHRISPFLDNDEKISDATDIKTETTCSHWPWHACDCWHYSVTYESLIVYLFCLCAMQRVSNIWLRNEDCYPFRYGKKISPKIEHYLRCYSPGILFADLSHTRNTRTLWWGRTHWFSCARSDSPVTEE